MKPNTLKQHRSTRLVNPSARKDNGCINLPYRGFVSRLDGSIVKHSPKRQHTPVSLKRQLYNPGKYRNADAVKRQALILAYAETGNITVNDFVSIFSCSVHAIRKDFRELERLGKLTKHGYARNTYYSLP